MEAYSYEPGSALKGLEALSAAMSLGSQSSFSSLPPFCNSNRTHATLNFLPNRPREPGLENLMPPVETLSAGDQDKLLTQELLYLLTGVESHLITIHTISHNKIGFMVDDGIEASLKDLVLQITQLAGYFYTVTRYLENWSKFEHGKVNQSLSAAVRSIVKEYLVLLAQMETLQAREELTLQKLWFFIHPSLQGMTIISSIVISIEENNARGGQVLTILHEKALSMVGDAGGQKLCYTLAEAACKPYFHILENWIYKGMIKDPFSEFFVYEGDRLAGIGSDSGEFVASDDYWDNRYKAEVDKCPSFLKKVENEILKAGKYLNVIRQCGKDICLFMGGKISYSIHERVYVNSIEKAYSFASKTLLDLLLNEYDLMRRIESVKHYLLMDQGDFIVQFLDLTEEELCKPVDDLNEMRLGSLLELALRTSSSCTDPYKDSVKVELFPTGIREMVFNVIVIESNLEKENLNTYQNIPGVEAFSFRYEVEWPISLILHQRAIYCYQMVFRHLFFCKHVERQLCRVWIGGKKYKKVDLKRDHEKSAAFSINQKMLNFVQNLQYYMAFEVIEPAWHIFLATMAKVQNVDQVMDAHTAFTASILDDSMLTNAQLLDKITCLLSQCLKFSSYFLKPKSAIPKASQSSKGKSPIETYDAQFSASLVEFLRDVSHIVQNPNQSSKVVNIIHRMNFNSYYTVALEGVFAAHLDESITSMNVSETRL